jgi:hypothetical protein
MTRGKHSWLDSVAVAAMIAGWCAGARADDGGAPRATTYGYPTRATAAPSPGPVFERWQAAIGVRTSVVRDAGLDPFSTADALAQFSMTVLHTLREGEGFVPALGLAADVGGSSASARGAGADLNLWRVALVFEPRFVPAPGFYAGARIAPGLLHTSVTLRDESTPVSLATAYWTPSLDASFSAGARLNPGMGTVGLWLLGDAGYGWAPRRELTLVPQLPARDASKAGATDLGSLSPRGMFGRVSLAVSY